MNLGEFLSPEAGQKRRKALNEGIGQTLDYFLGPTGIPERVALMGEVLNPVRGMEDASLSSQEMFKPGASGWDRLAAGGRMASEIAGVAVPMGAARFAGSTTDDAARAIQEALTGMSARPGTVAVKDFVADQSGAIGRTATGDAVSMPVSVKNEGSGIYRVFADGKDAGTISIAKDGGGDFVSAANLSGEFQGKRIGHKAYNLIEEDLGRRLVPSPLGLSANGMGFWRKRIGEYEPQEQIDAFVRSQQAGQSYGIPDSDINKRLYGVGGSSALDALEGAPDDITARGDQVLSMLKGGRGAEVTDDMLDLGDPVQNARLNEYLFNNYDLPMDEASRMGRAGEMGFDTGTPLYRGDERPNLQQFDTGRLAREGIGVTTSRSPNVAATYMTGDEGAMYPLVSRSQNPINIDAKGRNWTGIPADARANDGALNDLLDPKDYLDDDNLFDFINSRAVDWGDGTSTDLAITDTNSVSLAAQAKGFDEVRFNNIVDRGGSGQFHTGPANDPQTTVMTANPSNIRSRFARFDPRLAHLRNLSASGTLAAILGLSQENDPLQTYLEQ